LAEALYSMPPPSRAAVGAHHFALSSSPAAAAAAAGPAASPTSTSPTLASAHLPAPPVMAPAAGFNGYHPTAGHGDYQQQLGWDDGWPHRYHQAFSF